MSMRGRAVRRPLTADPQQPVTQQGPCSAQQGTRGEEVGPRRLQMRSSGGAVRLSGDIGGDQLLNLVHGLRWGAVRSVPDGRGVAHLGVGTVAQHGSRTVGGGLRLFA
eukprot:CAMPEP_0185155132 /NCGR_PEP_ID=MMETSP1139-20130426/249_1 /TAXON_ID=298111 /ORGANISM="Pavlova sp., Strain CCMP459" /LENGTH=107 /DNA_ID=CAMNT_0027720019 /DNA_START=469 /DNA_END=790 /DNA_ORIENTATION=-